MKYTLAILKNESSMDHEYWIKSCEKRTDISFDVIDLTANDWWEKVSSKKYDMLLTKPPGKRELFKRLYDERIQLLNDHTNLKIYPSLQEIQIYENKRYLRDWMMVNELPHPKTFIFFNKDEAVQFTSKTNFPIVAKTNIGASGNGVVILNNKKELLDYIEIAFSIGVRSKKGPKLKKGNLLKKIKKILKPGFLKQRLKDYQTNILDIQYGYVIFQQFIKHDYEWRCVRIGDSYFAHKKIAKNGKTSGTLLKGYDDVPHKLLDFIKYISEKMNLTSVSIDLFENNRDYLINEIQCFFGQSDPYQMLANYKPGRYVFKGNQWLFEEGMFNTNLSYDLRLEHAISLLEKK